MKKLITLLLTLLAACMVVKKYEPKEEKNDAYSKAKEKSGQFRQED